MEPLQTAELRNDLNQAAAKTLLVEAPKKLTPHSSYARHPNLVFNNATYRVWDQYVECRYFLVSLTGESNIHAAAF